MSADEISQKDTRHIARLARLSISDEEVEIFTRQLAAILDHARDIAGLEISSLEPTRHAVELTNVLRPDRVRPSLNREEVLAAAPRAEANLFVVPKILGEG